MFFSSLLSGATLRIALYAALAGLIGFGIYKFHYQPINVLKKEIVKKEQIITAREKQIRECLFSKHNLEELLKKAKADIETEKMNTELCYAEAEAYKDDKDEAMEANEKIKEDLNEGYLTF
jgi:hypothetical protein